MTDDRQTGDDRRAVVGIVSRSQLVRIGGGFAVAMILLAVLAVGLGLEDLRTMLSTASIEWIAVAFLSTGLCFAAWARSWQIVLGVIDVDEPFSTLVVTYAAATFANFVTPMGQAGGEPFIAYVLSRETDASFEDSLATVVTVDLLNLLASFGLALCSLVLLAARIDLPNSIESIAGGLAVAAIGVVILATISWRFRTRLAGVIEGGIEPAARLVPGLTVTGIQNRLRELYDAFNRIGAERRTLARAFVFSISGWALFVLPLILAGRAVGLMIGPFVAFFVVPASMLAGYVPSPGGLGSIEVVLTGLLLALVAVTAAEAYAITLIYRIATYWFGITVGGIAALELLRRQ